MLTPEQARAVLKEHADDLMKAEQRYLVEIKLLPEDLRRSAYAILDRDENGEPVLRYQGRNPEVERKQTEALWQLEVMTSQARRQIFSLFLPNLADYPEQAWQFLKTLPYQHGYNRKAFRASQPHTSFWKRINWFRQLLRLIGGYDKDLLWLAQYAPYINSGWGADTLAPVFAVAIDSGDALGNEVFDILVASAKGEHEIGTMGRHIPGALLSASRADGWDFIEKLLLAAQREEGLRQIILETVDEAHPEAFRRIMHLILSENLVRFSAVTRAVNVWFGFANDSENQRQLVDILATASKMLEAPEIRRQALEAGNGQDVYIALWSIAFEDVYQAIPEAAKILKDENLERRFAALQLLSVLVLPEASQAMIPALSDDDLRMVSHTCQSFYRGGLPQQQDLFEVIEDVVGRMPEKPRGLRRLVWDWISIVASKEVAAGLLLSCLGDRHPQRLLPYIGDLNSSDRVRAANLMEGHGLDDPALRDAVLRMAGDRNREVREAVIRIMTRQSIHPDDAAYLEGLLTRKANDLRRSILNMLVNQADDHVLASADRLIAAKEPLQRVAGLELLQILVEKDRQVSECRQKAESYRRANPSLDELEEALIRRVLKHDQSEYTLENVLGLIDPSERTRPVPPQPQTIDLGTPAAMMCLVALDELVHEYRHTPLSAKTWQGEQEVLLGNSPYALPYPDLRLPVEENLAELPLRDLWVGWYTTRPETMRDDDELELLRAWLDIGQRGYGSKVPGEQRMEIRYSGTVERILSWLIWLYEAPNSADFVLNMLEDSYASIFNSLVKQNLAENGYAEGPHSGWRSRFDSPYLRKLERVRQYRHLCAGWTARHHARMYGLLRWIDEPLPGADRHRPQLQEVLWAYEAGAANDADIHDQLLGPRPMGYYGGDFSDLRYLSSKKLHPVLEQYPRLREIFDECRERILEVELGRGEMPTAASGAAMALRSIHGINGYVRILGVFGKDNLTRGYTYNSQSRSTVLSHLLLVSLPAEDETTEDFVRKVKQAGLKQDHLIESAVYAPQWASYVEFALGWEGFASAVWWIHAHTKDTNWYVDAEIRETWQAQVSERTPLSGEDLLAGAVDVDWFWQVYETLGSKRWKALYLAAKYSSGGQGHTRAKLFADAMLGQVAREEVVNRLTKKRHQDSVRALGLLPLPDDGGDAEILARYQIMQEFVRGSRKFGSQRQESEKTAARIGVENLARTAGYPDPLRLQWAMEAEEVADLRDGPVSVIVDNVALTLRIDEVGKPHLDIDQNGKRLKNIPARLKKAEVFNELRERKKTIEKQHSRMRAALETAMCREDSFTASEVQQLTQHPVLAPMLEQTIFLSGDVVGYPVDGAAALQDHDGKLHPLSDDATLRIAHAYDLYRSREWAAWQRECFVAERIQPFKQVFRELYVLTEAEKLDGAISRRYAGHQVQPRQALALFGAREWVARPEEGVGRTFHKHRLSAFVTFLQGFYTPADVEGLTIEGVVFVEPGRWWRPLPLVDVPPILFSEVMRDMDLVVSVAHRGGVDPETTASTVAMRTALIRETCDLLRIDNVELRGNYALIEGKLGSYSVHLGSATVHRQPGGALCVIPVHAQHRGRIFLPFADDDPKTAEVISKVLLMARDEQIKDPTILSQIYAGG